MASLTKHRQWWLRDILTKREGPCLVQCSTPRMTDMTDHDRTDLDDLRASLVALSDRVTDVFLRGDTLRALLIEHGVFSREDFDEELQERQRLWSNRIYYLSTPKREADKVAQRWQRLALIKPVPE
jgi:hypothetical protein